MAYEQLKLENQLCFPVYAASRLIIREYKPHLENLGITYPQYLVLMILWEKDGVPVTEIGSKLVLKTNTVTPLLQRLETLGFIERGPSNTDDRQVIVHLTDIGRGLKDKAAEIPARIAQKLMDGPFSSEDLFTLKLQMDRLVEFLS